MNIKTELKLILCRQEYVFLDLRNECFKYKIQKSGKRELTMLKKRIGKMSPAEYMDEFQGKDKKIIIN